MASFFSLLNSFIPFADPSRPLWRDVLLSAVLCTVLYVAPQIDLNRFSSVPEHKEQPERAAIDEPAGDEHVQNEATDVVVEEANGNDDPIDVLGNEAQEQEPPQVHQPQAEAGPAAPNAHQPRPREPNREVGTKKAKAIARRNQQRAYNEWLREEGDAQRAEWARDQAERDEEIKKEQERRRQVEERVRDKERKEREARKTKEEEMRRAELEASNTAVRMVHERLTEKNYISIAEVMKAVKRDEDWARELLRREGIVGTKSEQGKKYAVVVTESGWVAKITSKVMDDIYSQVGTACQRGEGKVLWPEMGRMIQHEIVSSG